MREVQARAAADLHRASPRTAEQLTALGAQPSSLADAQEGVIQDRERARPSRRAARRRDLCDAVLHDRHHRYAAGCSASLAWAICAKWPVPVIESQSRPSRAASATAAVREPRPSLRRMFATWRCTVWCLTTSCSAISRSLNPLATSASTSRSRPESSTAAGSPPTRAGASGASTDRNARATDDPSPPHGKCALPSSGISVAPGIAAASSRPRR